MKNTKAFIVFTVLLCQLVFVSKSFATQIDVPAQGSVLENGSRLEWSASETQVDSWWIYVGSSEGANDYLNSGDLANAQQLVVEGLPVDDSIIHVRLWYKPSDANWKFSDTTFVAGTESPVVQITSPVAGDVLSGTSETFEWDANGYPVDRWWLYAGTSIGSRDIYDSGNLGVSTSADVNGIVTDGSTIHVRLWHQFNNGDWRFVDSTYQAATLDPPTITTPTVGTELAGVSATFSWEANETTTDEWWLYIGSSASGNQYFDSGLITDAMTVQATGLPQDDSTVFATLWYRSAGGAWSSIEAEYTSIADDTDAGPDLDVPPTLEEASSFLQAASFGPTQKSIDELANVGYSEWFQSQLEQPIDYIISGINPNFADTTNYKWEGLARAAWYDRAVFGADQLRQRAAFALSQIFVISTEPRNWMFKTHLQATYMDIMQTGAFGNFRDLLEDVTYSPLMGEWLTYIGNEKANAETGSQPDENYAREILQLFSIGLVELEDDGQPSLSDDTGEQIETYDLEDISGLSKVFTGLWWADRNFGQGSTRVADENIDVKPMVMHDQWHSPEEKSFLGLTIPAGTGGDESIRLALDYIFEHDNVGPFISKQLIQRMTTSNPSSQYVERVAQAFNRGLYTLPDGTVVGAGKRGDMAPVWAAILLDPDAHDSQRTDSPSWGKVREPIVRFLHWARAAGISSTKVTNEGSLERGAPSATIGQDPLRAKSVFNFYRPGYVAGGTLTGDQGLVAPELQITTTTTAIHYPNFMQNFVFRDSGKHWNGSYADQLEFAQDPDALTEHLNLTMTAGRMTDLTKQRVSETIASVENRRDRVQLGMLLVVNSTEYNTQQ